MSTMALAAVLLVWVVLCAWTAHKIGALFTDSTLRIELKALVFVALLPLPVIDELIAKPQFDQLCAQRAVPAVNAAELRGRPVYLTEIPPEPVPGLLVPVQVSKRVYADERTRQPLLTFSVLSAQGGKLARALGIGGTPITFDGHCGPQHWQEVIGPLNPRGGQPAGRAGVPESAGPSRSANEGHLVREVRPLQ
ncbi:MAG: hypothetical protein V4609_17050 [Pseudomonadota bacterium]